MQNVQSISWEQLYDLNLRCGNIDQLMPFIKESLASIKEFCNYDEALVYFFDGNEKVCNQYLMNIDAQWSTMYLEHYAKLANGRYSFAEKMPDEHNNPKVNIVEWKNEPESEFVKEYIRARKLKSSLGFNLYDMQGRPRALVALDKTRNKTISAYEYQTLSLFVPMINNLHKKFYPKQDLPAALTSNPWEAPQLTPREKEVVNMLCQGISPSNISRILYVTPATTNKHIANIYQKMNVSSIQELLVKVFTAES